MAKLMDLTGQRFGRLVVVEREGTYKTPEDPFSSIPTWRCICDCGTETVVLGPNLRRGRTRSCGCLRRDKLKEKWREYGEYRAQHL